MKNMPLPYCDPEEVGISAAKLGSISNLISKAIDDKMIPGAVTVIARKGKIVHAEAQGYKDMEAKSPLALDSLFRMYSQTKPLVAALTMRLYEKGLILLDMPITQFLPEFSNLIVNSIEYSEPSDHVRGCYAQMLETPACRDITIRDLLTMSSGFSTHFPMVAASHQATLEKVWRGTGFHPSDLLSDSINNPDRSYEEMVLAVSQLPLASHPGRRWHYSADFDVLTLLLERATGSPIDELISKELLEPLGMLDSDFYCHPEKLDRLTTEYGWDTDGNMVVRDRPETSEKSINPDRKLMSGNGLFGGIISTPGDYLRYAQMMLDNGIWKGNQLLGRKTVELMTTDHIPDSEVDLFKVPGYGFGFGVGVRRTLAGVHMPGSVGEFGWGGAGGTSYFVDPSEELVGLFFTHVFCYQFHPLADLYDQFQARAYQSLL
ncbi:serine hydrolase domain-containing protein [Pseudomaricurvus alkylphenolicus]|uniref:serine hydrolase domain-containing protein n=1 Tax=Pseudomaricurvus alkylphenolicus TaxID=1306991 RepID=UPI001F10B07E|nr:beta-lactamase family protein [Pseudomaricurvus alkylphenolicus]